MGYDLTGLYDIPKAELFTDENDGYRASFEVTKKIDLEQKAGQRIGLVVSAISDNIKQLATGVTSIEIDVAKNKIHMDEYFTINLNTLTSDLVKLGYGVVVYVNESIEPYYETIPADISAEFPGITYQMPGVNILTKLKLSIGDENPSVSTETDLPVEVEDYTMTNYDDNTYPEV